MRRELPHDIRRVRGSVAHGTELNDPLTDLAEIDRVLATCARFKRRFTYEIRADMLPCGLRIASYQHGKR